MSTATVIATAKDSRAAAGLVGPFLEVQRRIDGEIAALGAENVVALRRLREQLEWMDVPQIELNDCRPHATPGQVVHVVRWLDEATDSVRFSGYESIGMTWIAFAPENVGRPRRGRGQRHGSGHQGTYLGTWRVIAVLQPAVLAVPAWGAE